EIAGGIVEELIYEGYGPGGVALIVETATDNKNRTAADIRSVFAKYHGHLAASGAVSYMFKQKGQITVSKDGVDEDKFMEIALDAGADDLTLEDESFGGTTPNEKFYQLAEATKN